MIIQCYDKSERGKQLFKLLEKTDGITGHDRIIILPIPSTRDGVCISGTDITLAELARDAMRGTLITGYGMPLWVKAEIKDRGATLVDCSEDEEFLLENALLTSQAALGIILSESKRAPGDMKLGIVGYGRIGKDLARLLLFMGADICVFTSRAEVLAELGSMGVCVRRSEEDARLDDLDLIINTAPKRLFAISGEGESPPIMDLASGECYKDLPNSRQYPSLPAKCFPESAGNTWFRSILRSL